MPLLFTAIKYVMEEKHFIAQFYKTYSRNK